MNFDEFSKQVTVVFFFLIAQLQVFSVSIHQVNWVNNY